VHAGKEGGLRVSKKKDKGRKHDAMGIAGRQASTARARDKADRNGLSENKYTVIAPWISSTDWTHFTVEYFAHLFPGATIICGGSGSMDDSASEPFAFLSSKLEASSLIHRAARKGQLSKRVLLIDTNFVNIRALRTLLGDNGWMAALVNGGAFQPFDFDHQAMPRWAERIADYEGGVFGLCDRLILPSQHARLTLLNRLPDLAQQVIVVPYPVRHLPRTLPTKSGKRGALFISRPSFEKGIDLIDALSATKIPIERLQGLTHADYLAQLSRHLCVLLPARAELFGHVAIDAINAGTVPLVPAGLSYPEFLDLPASLFLGHPVGEATQAEMMHRIQQLETMSECEYSTIIGRARLHLDRVFADRDARFRAAFMAQ
jgi:hypothetical protein